MQDSEGNFDEDNNVDIATSRLDIANFTEVIETVIETDDNDNVRMSSWATNTFNKLKGSILNTKEKI